MACLQFPTLSSGAAFMQTSVKPHGRPMARQLTWIDDGKFEGWTCSECAWTYPIPELLADPEAKAAYDRIASANFRKHACRATPEEQKPSHQGNIQRLRNLVIHGMKPKDAVEIMLREVAFECRGHSQTIKKARADAEEFLRQISVKPSAPCV